MLHMNTQEVLDAIEDSLQSNPDEYDVDYDGQVIVYTGVYRWKDGSYHDEPDVGEDS